MKKTAGEDLQEDRASNQTHACSHGWEDLDPHPFWALLPICYRRLTGSGHRCRRRVKRPGDHCHDHSEQETK